jgi:GNAT superfamily N-acetyltransferase
LLIEHLEEISFNAWPAREQVRYDGWVLRFSQGYTKRANSVTPLYPGSLGLEAKIEYCQAAYRSRGLPPIFRLPELEGVQELDRLLERKGYRVLHPTQVLWQDLADWELGLWEGVVLEQLSLETWLAAYADFSVSQADKLWAHKDILQRITARRLFAAIPEAGKIVTVGLAVLEEGACGLFDIITAPEHRKQGFATRLVRGMLDWALERGAQSAYLQVMDVNQPALQLYGKLGFSKHYSYHYRLTEVY